MPQDYGFVAGSTPPSAGGEGSQKQKAVDALGFTHNRVEEFSFAEMGALFRAFGSATPMAGIAQTVAVTAFSATNAALIMVNGSSTKKVVPYYIRMTNTAAGASSTSSAFAVAIDSANRYSSGGTDILSLVTCSNSALGPTSGLSALRVGAVTASAAGAGTRYQSQGQLKVQAAPCWVVGDEILFTFGNVQAASLGALNGAAPIQIVKHLGPVVLGGQDDSLLLHLWNPANATTAPSWSFEIAWFER